MNGLRLEHGTDRHTAERSRLFGFHSFEPLLATITIALGLTHAWIGRYSINPDGISYLDVGDSFTRGDWGNAVNAYWSPLYGWLLGIVNAAVRPSPRWEFPLAHLVNFGVFLLALLAFRYLQGAVLAFRNAQVEAGITDPSATVALPEWVFVLLGYAIFLWAALELETIYDLSPDLSAMACLCFAAGVLLRLELSPGPGKFALLGLVLGIGYWIKAPLFPIAFVFLICSYLWKRSLPQWRRGLLLATAVFLCTSAPLLVLLSQQKHRFTFGDSGRLNYAWFVSPATPWRNWHGEPAGSGSSTTSVVGQTERKK
jgi:hypothetical protein